jgi:hypothetical protein
VSPFKHHRRSHEENHLQGELRTIKPPTFDGENKMGEDAEDWFLGIRKYFQLKPNTNGCNMYHMCMVLTISFVTCILAIRFSFMCVNDFCIVVFMIISRALLFQPPLGFYSCPAFSFELS